MRLALHPDARAEYGAAVQFYDQLRAGLGIRFIFCVEAALRAVLESPFASPVLDPGVRRRLTRARGAAGVDRAEMASAPPPQAGHLY